VRELLARVSSSELTELVAFELIEPRGERRGDLRSALIASTIANTAKSSDSDPYTLDGFLFEFYEEELTDEEIAAHDETLIARATGKTSRG
jgi:hypothetical protein